MRQFIVWSAKELGIEVEFYGRGVEEKVIVAAIEGDNAPALKVGDVIALVDPRYYRPTEVESLLGDPSNAKMKLGWVPEITAQEMCAEMVKEDLITAKRSVLLKSHGHEIPLSRD